MVSELVNANERSTEHTNGLGLSIEFERVQQSKQGKVQRPEPPKPEGDNRDLPVTAADRRSLSQQAWDLMEAAQWRLRSWTDHTRYMLSPTGLWDSGRGARSNLLRISAVDAAEYWFPKVEDANYRFLVRKMFLHNDLGGPDLTTAEAASLAARRKEIYEEAFVQQALTVIPNEQDAAIRDLYRRDQLAVNGMGPALSPQERQLVKQKVDAYDRQVSATKSAQEAFPAAADQKYRELKKRELLGQTLTASEASDLKSKTEFPDDLDENYRQLLRQELLFKAGEGPPLTAQQKVALDSKLAFRSADRDHRAQYEARPGHGPNLSAEELSSWLAMREFPNDKYLKYRDLATKDNLSKYGGRGGLRPADASELCAKRGTCDLAAENLADNIKQLKLAAAAVNRLELGALDKFQKMLAVVPQSRVHSLHHSLKDSRIPVEIVYQPAPHLEINNQEFKLKQRKEELLKDVPGLSEDLDQFAQSIAGLNGFGSYNSYHKMSLGDLFHRVQSVSGYQGVEALIACFNDKLGSSGYSTQAEYTSYDSDPKRSDPQYKPSIDGGDRILRMHLRRTLQRTEWMDYPPGTRDVKVDEFTVPHQW